MPQQPVSLALFCKVVDNFGDIGICWRLARQLAQEHALAVTLWVDDLPSFARICPGVDGGAERQHLQGVTVRHWRGQDGQFGVADVADIVVEFFGVDLPPGYIAAMAACPLRPLWFNLEGLSAEQWVEGCHALPSMHPRLPLTKHFFFPGFTAQTGGLLREGALLRERDQFVSDPANGAAFLARFGLDAAAMAATKVSLFCYPHAPVAALFDAWRDADAPTVCLVPDGVASAAVGAFLGGAATPGAARTIGSLTLQVVPFVAQPDYDRLLWSCDVNFVRGEDSFVRAQWAAKPFIWHIYPQDEDLHHVKLRAFLQRYAAPADSLEPLALRWNGAPESAAWQGTAWPALWRQFRADMPALTAHAADWERRMLANGDLASNLLAFADSLRQDRDGETRQN